MTAEDGEREGAAVTCDGTGRLFHRRAAAMKYHFSCHHIVSRWDQIKAPWRHVSRPCTWSKL